MKNDKKALIAVLIDNDNSFSKGIKEYIRENKQHGIIVIRTLQNCTEASEFIGSISSDLIFIAENCIDDMMLFSEIIKTSRCNNVVILTNKKTGITREYPQDIKKKLIMISKTESFDKILEAASIAYNNDLDNDNSVLLNTCDNTEKQDQHHNTNKQDQIVAEKGCFTDYKVHSDNKATAKNDTLMICVYSPQGGSGKTTISFNMAIHYASKGLKVLFVDLSLFGGVNTYIKTSSTGKGLNLLLDVLRQDELLFSTESCIPYIKDAVVGYIYPQMEVLLADNPIGMEAIKLSQTEQLLGGFTRCDYDVVVVDTSSELCERNIACILKSDYVLVPLLPDATAGWKMMQLKEQVLSRLGIEPKKINIVVNKYVKSASGIPAEFEKTLDYTVIDTIPDFYKELSVLGVENRTAASDSRSKINLYIKKVASKFMNVFQPKDLVGRGIIKWH